MRTMETSTVENQEAPKPALPLLLLLGIASALGVAVAIALAGVAMLLAVPAYADEGILLLERRTGLEEAELLFAESESSRDGLTRVVEDHHNPFAEPLVAVYLYRLPSDAVLERLTFAPGSAEVLPAVLTRRQGSALIERAAEIGPGETLRVELEYRVARCRWPS
jgi:hypothetical protein